MNTGARLGRKRPRLPRWERPRSAVPLLGDLPGEPPVLSRPRAVDQGAVPCCVPAAFVRAIEIRTAAIGGPLRALSHLFINYYARGGRDFDARLDAESVIRAILTRGLALERFDPKGPRAAERTPSRDAQEDARARPVAEGGPPFSVLTDPTRADLRAALQQGLPLVLFFYQSSEYLTPGAALSPAGFSTDQELHAVCAYGATEDGLLIADSQPKNFSRSPYWTMPWEIAGKWYTPLLIVVGAHFAERPPLA